MNGSVTEIDRAADPAIGLAAEIVLPIMEVRRYRKACGWETRYWGVYRGGELLAVCLYKKGAQAVVDLANQLAQTSFTRNTGVATKVRHRDC